MSIESSKAHAQNIIDNLIDIKVVSNVLTKVLSAEVTQLRKARNIKLDSGLIPIYRDQRNKWSSICKIVNKHYDKEYLDTQMFDDGFVELYPSLSSWYTKSVLNIGT